MPRSGLIHPLLEGVWLSILANDLLQKEKNMRLVPSLPRYFVRPLVLATVSMPLGGVVDRRPVWACRRRGAVSQVEPAAVKGSVHGGQQPVGSALVTQMAASTAGYGNAPTVLANTVSGSDGSFTLPGHICPTPDSLVYIQATGGDAGDGPNSAINLVAIVGNCSAATSSLTVNVDEVTTVAAAYALAPFASVTATGTGIGTTSTNITGLNNAAGPANNLVNIATGQARGVNEVAGLILPTDELNALADILASCVNCRAGLGQLREAVYKHYCGFGQAE